MATQIQLRNGTASAWTSANPTLAVGEMGAETDTGRFKIGTGSTAWNSLGYSLGVSSKGTYSGATQYYVNDIVLYGGSSYICILASLGNLPTNGTYWNLLVQAGNVSGPGSSTDTAIATFNGAGGATLQNTTITLSATGTIAAASGTMTLTNPTVTNYVETLYSANTSTAITVSLTNGTVQNLTLTGNATITMPTAVAGKSFIIILSQDATGSRTVTWSTVSWPSATAPTVTSTASKRDIFSFFSNGTSWFGTTIGQNYT
jgi:hypothetical protein